MLHYGEKGTIEYENMLIYYIIIVVNLLHVSSSGMRFYEGYITKITKSMYRYKILSLKCLIILKYKIQIKIFVLSLRE